MFCELAMMFDRIAYEFRRFENDRHPAPNRNGPIHRRASAAGSTWLARLTSA